MANVTLTLSQALSRAFSAYNAGKLVEAEQLCQQIINAKPDLFDALHLLGVIQSSLGKKDAALASYDCSLAVRPDHAEVLSNRGTTLHELKRFEEALASYDRALAVLPDYAEAYSNRGVTLHKLGRFDEALASYDRALTVRPDYAEAHSNRGITLYELGRFVEALASHDRALAVQPDYAEAHSNRGTTLHELKRFEEALASYHRALTVRPDFAGAHSNRGMTLHELGRFEEALASYDRALAVRPDFAEALSNRGRTLHELGRFKEALASYDQALTVRPNYAEAHSNRGRTLHELRRFEEALASYDRALTVRPDYAEVLSNRGNTLNHMGKLDSALADLRRALVLKPDLANAHINMGSALKRLGQLRQAQEAFLDAIALDPGSTSAYLDFSDCKFFTPGDPHLATMEALAAKTEGLSSTHRMQLAFALGKAYADAKDYRRSFQHLLEGNASKRARISYDEKSALALFDRIEAVFTPELIKAKHGGCDPSPLPIFVLGMPRSGTTLVEQIIASHPLVHGAGELETHDLTVAMRGPDGNMALFPECVPALDALALKEIGAHYVASLRKLAPTAERITDKTPSNYYFVGLIQLVLPNSKIIRTIRDPVDTCISCFSKLFAAGQNHTYDLGELGRYYKRYEQLMTHWRQVLPAGRILDVRYENVVSDVEGQARRIIAHCGLPWDERCLSFHKTDRPVRTASATQVRQPIYKSAVGRWRVYEEHLGPLLSALGIAAEA